MRMWYWGGSVAGRPQLERCGGCAAQLDGLVKLLCAHMTPLFLPDTHATGRPSTPNGGVLKKDGEGPG